MPAPCVPSPCHAVAHLCIVMLCQCFPIPCPCKGLHISTVPPLRRAMPRRNSSFRCQCGSRQVHALTKQLSAVPSPLFALPIPSLPCRYITVLRFAHPLPSVSLQIHNHASQSKSSASPCQAEPTCHYSIPMPIMTLPLYCISTHCLSLTLLFHSYASLCDSVAVLCHATIRRDGAN